MHIPYQPTGQNEDYGRQYPRFAPSLHVLGHFACEPVVCHHIKKKKSSQAENHPLGDFSDWYTNYYYIVESIY